MNRYPADCRHAVSGKMIFFALSVLSFSTLMMIASSVAQSNQPSGAQSKPPSGGQAIKDSDLQQFAGTWEAKFKDKVFQTLKLEKRDGKLTGTMSRGNIAVNDQGELTNAEVLEGESTIVEAKAVLGVLLFTTKRNDEEETSQFEMKLTGVDEAELTFVGIPESSVVKPWKLQRVKTER